MQVETADQPLDIYRWQESVVTSVGAVVRISFLRVSMKELALRQQDMYVP